MEADWILDRSRLWQRHLEHPGWGAKRLCRFSERSLTWVKKWLRRLRGADPDDETVLHSRSRARKTSPRKACQMVVERILAIRDEPSGNLKRTPGPKAILYYLNPDPELRQQKLYLPRSTRTIWQILRQNGRIFRPSPPEHELEERPEPMSEWGIDFKEVRKSAPYLQRKTAGGNLARSAHDVSLGLFRELLDYKAMEAGVEVVTVNPAYTSQACSGCGCIVPKKLSVRTHHCPDCGLTRDRDVNAARIILSAGTRRSGVNVDGCVMRSPRSSPL